MKEKSPGDIQKHLSDAQFLPTPTSPAPSPAHPEAAESLRNAGPFVSIPQACQLSAPVPRFKEAACLLVLVSTFGTPFSSHPRKSKNKNSPGASVAIALKLAPASALATNVVGQRKTKTQEEIVRAHAGSH